MREITEIEGKSVFMSSNTYVNIDGRFSLNR